MSSFNPENPSRRNLLRIGALGLLAGSGLALSGCFRPMLASGGEAADLRGRIALPEIEGRTGYYLVKALESRLGTPVRPEWELRVALGTRRSHRAIRRNNQITRIALRTTARWSLHRKGEEEPVLSAQAYAESGYDATNSLYGNREARLDVERRLARDLGDRIARAVLARADDILAGGAS